VCPGSVIQVPPQYLQYRDRRSRPHKEDLFSKFELAARRSGVIKEQEAIMKYNFILISSAALCALMLVGCVAAGKQNSLLKSEGTIESNTKLKYKDIMNGDKYVLTIEDSNYVIGEDSELVIHAPQKNTIRIKIRKEEYNNYYDHGISFDYSSDMKVEEGNLNGITMIKLNGAESFFIMLQILPLTIQTDNFVNTVINGTLQKLQDAGNKFEKELDVTIESNNGNQNVPGKRVIFANKLIRIKQEDYMLKKNDSNIFILIQMTVNKNEAINDEKAKRLLNSIQ
jgi:hypothetical protein